MADYVNNHGRDMGKGIIMYTWVTLNLTTTLMSGEGCGDEPVVVVYPAVLELVVVVVLRSRLELMMLVVVASAAMPAPLVICNYGYH